MANLDDFYDELNNFSVEVTNDNWDGLTLVGSLLGTVADIGGAIGIVNAVIGVVNLITGSDDNVQAAIQKLSNQIAAGLNELIGIDRTNALIAELERNDTVVADARAAFDSLPTLLAAPAGSVSLADRVGQIESCLKAVEVFDNDSEWFVNGSLQLYYSDSWSGTVGPPPDQIAANLAFSTLYKLQVFIRSVTPFLTVGAALLPGTDGLPSFSAQYQDALKKANNRVNWLYNQSLAGLTTLRVPAQTDLYSYSIDGNGQPVLNLDQDGSLANAWGVQPYGVVDRYGAAAAVAHYPPIKPPTPDDPRTAGVFGNLFLMLSIANYVKYRQAYYALGLPALAECCATLHEVIGGQPEVTDRPLSLRYVSQLLGTIFVTPGQPKPSIIARLNKLAGLSVARPMSLRAALQGIPGPAYQFPPGL